MRRRLNDFTAEEIRDIGNLINALARRCAQQFPRANFNDLVQEGWRIFYFRARKYFDRSKRVKLTTWFYKVYYTYILQYIHKDHKKTVDWCELKESQELTSPVSTEPFEQTAFLDLYDNLNKMLSPCAKKLLHSYSTYDGQLSAFDISKILGISEKDVKFVIDEVRLTTKMLLNYDL